MKKAIRISESDIRSIVREAVSPLADGVRAMRSYAGIGEDEGENGGFKREVSLTESQMREFVSYSVARLLKEALGRRYGVHSFTFSPDEEDLAPYLDMELNYDEIPEIAVEYKISRGMPGDKYLTPDDDDKFELLSWNVVNRENVPDEAISAVRSYMDNDFDIEEAAGMHDYGL